MDSGVSMDSEVIIISEVSMDSDVFLDSEVIMTSEVLVDSPHVDVEGLGDVDLKASRPRTVGGVHEPHAQQLVIVVAGPVEDHAGARQGGDVPVWIGRALRQTPRLPPLNQPLIPSLTFPLANSL